MSNNTISYRDNLCGYRGRHVPRGRRTAFSMIMNERATQLGLADDRPIIDAILSHKSKAVEMAYNRARHMPRPWDLAR